ncbi:MAG: GntR family transcriptional regulator [Rhodospirillales bacterium]|nr:GntR family transcriptional regulator [Rhodospirillales bacterium]
MKIDRRQSTAYQIYDSLHQQIIDMSRVPGSVISKQDIAKSFEVSPSPVRDALLRLQSEGLVDIVPQSKTSVSLIDVQKARELHFLRLSVEIEVVRELSKRITAEQLAELEVWNARLSVEFKAENTTAFRLTDTAFHERLYDFAGVPGIVDIIQAHRGHYDRIRGLYLAFGQRQKRVILEHKEIHRAIKAGDPLAAENAVRQHLGKSLAIIEEIRAQNPTYFKKEDTGL